MNILISLVTVIVSLCVYVCVRIYAYVYIIDNKNLKQDKKTSLGIY